MIRHIHRSRTRIIARCREIAACTEVPGEITRLFLTPPMHEVHALLRGWMEAAGMTVHVDAIGNLRGLWPGLRHGRRASSSARTSTRFPTPEPSTASSASFSGSPSLKSCRGNIFPLPSKSSAFPKKKVCASASPSSAASRVVGKLDAETLARTDRNGISVREAIQTFGLDPAQLPAAVLSDDAFAYLEFHIEQGPVLESEDASLGIVEALVGQTRMQLVFTGQANHAGTTPMHLRHDAMAAAAEWIVAVEDYASLAGRSRRDRRQSRSLAGCGKRHRRTRDRFARRTSRRRHCPQSCSYRNDWSMQRRPQPGVACRLQRTHSLSSPPSRWIRI